MTSSSRILMQIIISNTKISREDKQNLNQEASSLQKRHFSIIWEIVRWFIIPVSITFLLSLNYWNENLNGLWEKIAYTIYFHPGFCNIPHTISADDDEKDEVSFSKWVFQSHYQKGMVGLVPKRVRLAPNGTNLTRFGTKPTIPFW